MSYQIRERIFTIFSTRKLIAPKMSWSQRKFRSIDFIMNQNTVGCAPWHFFIGSDKKMILFLDFDGVLHSEPCYDETQLFSSLPPLEAMLRDFPEVKIVISSTWRESRSLSELQSFFSHDIGARIIGVTPSWRDIPDLVEVIGYQRHAEIEAWIRNSEMPWQPWIAVDDKPFLFKPFLPNLIKTNSSTGLDEIAIASLRQRLQSAIWK